MGPQWRQSVHTTPLPIGEADRLDELAVSDWFAVQVRAGRESFSAEHLQVRGYEVFLPLHVQHRRWSDRVKKVRRALFEGYVFCRDAATSVARIITTPGVIRVVGDTRGPIAIPLAEIEVLQQMVAQQLPVEPWPFYESGRLVRIEAGPFQGSEGVVVMMKNQYRLIVSIPLLRRSVAAEIPTDWVYPISPSVRVCERG